MALAGLAGWMALMGLIWMIYGIGLKGEDPTWKAVSGRTVLQDTWALLQTQVLDGIGEIPDDATSAEAADTVAAAVRRRGLGAHSTRRRRSSVRPAHPRRPSSKRRAPSPPASSRCSVFDTGGERYPKLGDSIDFLAFFHKPHYVVVEVAPLVPTRAEPGARRAAAADRRAPANTSTCTWSAISGTRASRPRCSRSAARSIFLSAVLDRCTAATRRRQQPQPRPPVPPRLTAVSSWASTCRSWCWLVLAVVFGGAQLRRVPAARAEPAVAAKEAPYECGIVPCREPPERFPVSFYIVAMLFIMFDIEIIFVYPYAVSRSTLGSFGFWSMFEFSVIFFIAFVYVVARGGLDWGPLQRSVTVSEGTAGMVSADARPAPRSGASASRAGRTEAACEP